MNELRPKLFDVMKGYTTQQLTRDIVSGIIVAIDVGKKACSDRIFPCE